MKVKLSALTRQKAHTCRAHDIGTSGVQRSGVEKPIYGEEKSRGAELRSWRYEDTSSWTSVLAGEFSAKIECRPEASIMNNERLEDLFKQANFISNCSSMRFRAPDDPITRAPD
jgi:hypothetical protein